ncbi:TlpA family protein disulfide reductase [Cohnella cellulosilytica]|uniref:TlpA family protein disulfide reductase n=2 Tax=Cohnella cellulosilytica TaxID=986710 RepID=A0ABW2FKA3_9BACL
MRRNLIILAIAVIAVAGVWIWDGSGRGASSGQAARPVDLEGIPASPAPKADHFAPAFQLNGLLDETAAYSVGGKRDKALIVNFWAAWCGPCEVEAPDLKAIYEEHQDKLDLYAVNATNYDRVRSAKEFVAEQGLEFPVLTDPQGVAGDLYKITGYPVSFIIDRDGVIRHRIEGIVEREEWDKMLRDVL